MLALGDSYTVGEGVSPGLGWPDLLADALGQEGVPVRGPRIVARTGWTTEELALGLGEAGLSRTFDLVFLLVGVNDQYRGRPLRAYRTAFGDLLSRAVVLAGGEAGRVVVLSIPDWGVTPFGDGEDRDRISREIDEFNVVAFGESQTWAVRFVDVTGISREAGANRRLLAQDGLHPSEAMYRRWVEVILPVVRRALDLRPGGGHSPRSQGT